MLLPVREQALAVLTAGQALLTPIGIFGGHDPFDRAEPVVELTRGLVQFVEQLFVAARSASPPFSTW